ncbi:MAG: TolC family protein [Deltaproteobacteria bacterium]|nr:TolC family protein [Deltaproteobacteria bacterium]
MRRRATLIGLLVLSQAGAAVAQEGSPRVMRLDEVLRAVKQNNAHLMAARSGIEAAEGQHQMAWTAWQPDVKAIGNITFNNTEAQFDNALLVQQLAQAFQITLTPEALAALPEPIVIQPYVQLAALLTARQTLFNITALRAPGVASKGVAAAERAVEAAEDEILFQTAQIYSGLVGMKELESASVRAIEVAEKRIQDAKVQLEAGTATKLSVTRAETDKILAEGQRLSVREQRRTLLATLRALAGIDEPIEVATTPLEESVSIEAQGGIEDKSSIKAKVAAAEAAEAAIGLTTWRWLPTLAADGTLRYSNVEGFSGERFAAMASVNLIIPLYDSGVRYAEGSIAEAKAAQAQHELEAARREAAAALEAVEARLTTAKDELEQAKAQLRLTTELVAQVEALVKNGLATSLDLTDADSKRFGADRLVVQRTFELEVAKLRVAQARGGKLLKD